MLECDRHLYAPNHDVCMICGKTATQAENASTYTDALEALRSFRSPIKSVRPPYRRIENLCLGIDAKGFGTYKMTDPLPIYVPDAPQRKDEQ